MKKIILFVGLLGMLFSGVVVGDGPVVDDIDWAGFMGRHDMVWGTLPTKWSNGPFLGNGEQGTVMFKLDEKTIRWDVGCSAAHDHRAPENDDLDEKNPSILNRGRHFIGHLRLLLPEKIDGVDARLSLWDAEARGVFNAEGGAENGSLKWRTVVHASEPVMRYEIVTSEKMAGAKFVYVPEMARSPRAVRAKSPRKPANPAAVLSKTRDGVETAVQNLYAGGQTAVAWTSRTVGDKTVLWLSVLHSYPENDAAGRAVAAVRKAAGADQDAWLSKHRQWWHDYYPASFVSVGETYWDSFYWIQQYKRACATRDNEWIIDNQGPWLQFTAWNGTWWDLNIQLSHSGVNKANRKNMATALSYRLGLNRDNLAYNVPEKYRHDSYAIGGATSGWDLVGRVGEPGKKHPTMDPRAAQMIGNLLWAMHNVDMEYLYWKDTNLRDEILYPLLTRAVNYYRHFLVMEDDGRLHLPRTYSPEYRFDEDCSYDISLLKWAVGRLITMAGEKGLVDKTEPLLKEWKKIDEKLVPLHIHPESGIMVGRKLEFNSRHRHWSHLLGIYPLRIVVPDSKENYELIDKSLTNWSRYGASFGYAFTGRACMSAILGDGQRAYDFLSGLKKYLQPNTFYHELGKLPVMETPLHGATVMQDMLMQCWGGKIRVFPAVPNEWGDSSFHQLRTEGAFLVSAKRSKGKTRWVAVQSQAGGKILVDCGIAGAKYKASKGMKVVRKTDLVFEIVAKPGSWITFKDANWTGPVVIKELPGKGEPYRFGLMP